MPKYSKLPFKTKIQAHEKRLRTSFPKPLERFDNVNFIVKREKNTLIWDIDISSLVNNSHHFKIYKINKNKISYELTNDVIEFVDLGRPDYKLEFNTSLEERSRVELGIESKEYRFSWNLKFKGHVIEVNFQNRGNEDISNFREIGVEGFSKDYLVNILGYMKGRGKFTVNELESRFNMKKGEIMTLISKLKTNGIIEVNSSGETITVSKVMPPDISKTIWEDTEVFVIGYIKLNKIVSTSDISKDLDLDIELVEKILFSNIYQERVDAALGIRGKNTENLFVQTLHIPTLNLFHQVVYNSIPPKEWEDRVGINYSSTEIISGISSNQPLLQVIKTVAGILILRGEAMVDSLFREISFPPILGEKWTKREGLWKILSILALSEFIDLTIDENRIYYRHKTDDFKVGEILPVLGFEEFNYNGLIGLLSGKRSISLSSLTSRMSKDGLKWEEKEILQIIANLAMDGTIRGHLDADNTLNCQYVLQPDDQEFTLKRDEKILLGSLIAKSKTTLKDCAKILQKSENEVKQAFYSLRIQDQILGEISRGGEILIQNRKNIPLLPPLIQVYNLPIINREILGYTILNQKKKIKLSEYISLWDTPKLDIEQILLDAVGSGIIHLNLTKTEVKYLNHTIQQPPPAFNQKFEADLIKLTEFLEKHSDPLNISEIKTMFNLEERVVLKKLSYLVGSGYYPKGMISSGLFTKGDKLRVFAVFMSCLNCGTRIMDKLNLCPECNSEIKTCIVCKGYFEHDDQLGECPNCNSIAHKDHLQAWLLIKNECPICKSEIMSIDADPIMEESKK